MRKIYQSVSALYKEQNGASMILVALSMLMLIGFTALVVDVGSLYFEKSRLQKSLDAAVLGGAQKLKGSKAEAINVAIDLASNNGFVVTQGEVTTGDNFIEIRKTVNKDLFFARVLGFNQTDVSATARAEIQGSLIEANGVVPIGLEKKDYKKDASYALNETPGEGDSGNYGFVAIDGNGNELEGGIMNGAKKTVKVGGTVSTEPGVSWGNVKPGIKHRLNEEGENPNCNSYEKADYSCKRVVILPLIDTFKNGNGRHDVTIVGFVAFWIESLSEDEKEIKGRFIEIVTSGTFGPGTDYGIYGVKLVK